MVSSAEQDKFMVILGFTFLTYTVIHAYIESGIPAAISPPRARLSLPFT